MVVSRVEKSWLVLWNHCGQPLTFNFIQFYGQLYSFLMNMFLKTSMLILPPFMCHISFGSFVGGFAVLYCTSFLLNGHFHFRQNFITCSYVKLLNDINSRMCLVYRMWTSMDKSINTSYLLSGIEIYYFQAGCRRCNQTGEMFAKKWPDRQDKIKSRPTNVPAKTTCDVPMTSVGLPWCPLAMHYWTSFVVFLQVKESF